MKIPIDLRLEKIIHYLYQKGIKAIIVGGYVRDTLMHLSTPKDIDIELYGVDNLHTVATILEPFGKVLLVGESFGVCKLQLDDLEIDFSLPRKESKVAKGHKGFTVQLYSNISFCEAAKRRDFTINALGYDPIKVQLLDCFGGLDDINKKCLRVVHEATFVEDPLRVFRAMRFLARLEFIADKALVMLCHEMVQKKMLQELPKERVFWEFANMFTKAKKPSLGIEFLKNIDENTYLKELFMLPKALYNQTLQTLNNLVIMKTKELFYYFAALLMHLNFHKILQRFSSDKKLLREVDKLLTHYNKLLTLCHNSYSDYDLKKFAASYEIKKALHFIKAIYPNLTCLQKIEQRAKELKVFTEPIKPLIGGDDLIKLGLKPSKKFQTILQELYDLQLQGYTKEMLLQELTLKHQNDFA